MVSVNLWAVFTATVVALGIGSFWYAQAVFGRAWVKLARIDTSKNRGSVLKPIAISAATSFITAYVLAHITYLAYQFFSYTFFTDAVVSALWLWLGLSAARFVTHDASEGRPWQLTLITAGYEFVTLVAMGGVIGAFGAPLN